jgi:hypothetical protein
MSTNKNTNPKVLTSTDARIEGQLQVEDSLVLDPRQNGSGSFVVLQADDNKITVNGLEVVNLDESGKIDPSNLPLVSLVTVNVVEDEEAQLDLDAQEGDVAVRSDENLAYMNNGGTEGDITDWTQISFSQVASVAGKTGEVDLEKADITDFDETDYAPSTVLDRQTLTQTVTVEAGFEASVSLPLATGFGLWKLTTNKPARVRIFSSDADRTADTSRAPGTLPSAGVGLVTEVVTTSELLSVPLTPPQLGASLETTPSSNISALVKNNGESADVSITIIWTPLG